MVDKKYCMSSYLMFRTIADHSKTFKNGIVPSFYDNRFARKNISTSEELEIELKKIVESACEDGKAALALSGGIDSAILAKFMPKGSVAYTFRCVVPGVETVDESAVAAVYAKECGLEHRIIDIYWDDIIEYMPKLMKHKGAPLHSIEIQIAKASEQVKQDGFTKFIFGESADANYGGLSNLLSRPWTVGEFIDRYSYVKPYHVLKDFEIISEPYKKYEDAGFINVHEFIRNDFYQESMGSYTNACDLIGIEFEAPFARTFFKENLDLDRVRAGENKYLIREIFERLYSDFKIPEKRPMPRATEQWLENWEGPKRSEFWENCIANMTGDQKWLVYCLEQFLNMIDENEI